jgi:N6-adenosine-specific RNA methylase IME4
MLNMLELKGTGKYPVIYADPPWRFFNFSAKGEGRNAISHYDCLTLEELRGLPILDCAARDCALFLWVPDPMVAHAHDIIRHWGFEFKVFLH